MLRSMLVTVAAGLLLTPQAVAADGHYVIDGGTPAEQTTIRKALDASSFDFGQVSQLVTITIVPGSGVGQASPGKIRIGASDLDEHDYGVVQHEYAHQVDYFLLTDAERAEAQRVLGGASWYPQPGQAHEDSAAERFASMLAWTFYLTTSNSQGPRFGLDTRAVPIGPAEFRAMLTRWGLVPPESSPPGSAPAPPNAVGSGAWIFFLFNPWITHL